MINEALQLLDHEQAEDEELRRIHGTRWTRTTSETLTRKLREKANEYRSKMDAANSSNGVVKRKMDANVYLIKHLEMDRQELEASIPSSTSSSTLALKDPNLKQLKIMLDNLNGNIKQRNLIITSLKKISETDDIAPRLTQSALNGVEFDELAIFDEQMKIYAPDTQLAQRLLQEQDKLLESIFVIYAH